MLPLDLCCPASDLARGEVSPSKPTQHNSGPSRAVHTLELLEKGHQSDLAMPGRRCSGIRDLAGAQSLGFHLEIDLRVDVRRVERDVAEPGANRVDVNAGTQQMDGRCVANHMGTDALGAQRRDAWRRLTGVAADHRVNSEAGDRLAAAV